MQPHKIGFAALALLTAISTPWSVSLAAVISAPGAVQTQDEPRQAQADQLVQQGLEQYKQGQLGRAIQSWQLALALYQQLQNRQGEGTTRGYLGAVHLALGNYREAVESLQPLLAITQARGDKLGEAQTLGNLGIAYKGLGQYEDAIASHEQALALMQALKNRQGEAQVLGNLGNAYEALGKYNKAIAAYEQSLIIARELGDRKSEAVALGSIGAIYTYKDDYTQAIEHYEESLAIAQDIGDRLGAGYTLNNLGSAHSTQGDASKALSYYQQSLAIAKAVADRQLEGEVLTNLGIAYEDLGDVPQAIAHHEQALAIAQAISNPRTEGVALNNLGHTLFNSGNLPEAEKNLRAAVKLLESLRPGLSDTDNVSVFDTQILTYNLLQQILIAQDKPEAALEIAEQGRARAFIELLAQRLSPEAIEQATLNSKPPTIAEIRQIAKAHNATLVEYALVPDEEFKVRGKLRGTASELLIWVVQPTGEVAFRRVDLKILRQPQEGAPNTAPTSLESLVTNSRILQGLRERQGEAARARLYQLLIEPIAEFLPTDPEAHVIFMPQESLFLVPFVALPDATGQYLIEKHTILTAPAIQVLALTAQQRLRLATLHPEPMQGSEILVVGNPTMPLIKVGETFEQLETLPATEEEALAIASLFNTKALIGDQATKVDIVQQLPQARLIHLATHGLLDDIRQLGIPGAIALAPSGNDDGFLTASELLNLKLNAELVVLSACDTGQGDITGDGVIGLSRSLIAAGVPSAIVSLWAVPDGPTAELMTEFYRNLRQNPDKAQALRSAMLTTLKQYPSPYNWAAFTLIGEAE